MISSIILILLIATNPLFVELTNVDQDRSFLFGNQPRPSPINLERTDMITRRTFTSLHFSPQHSSKEEIKKSVTENGLEVTLEYPSKKPTISGGPLRTSFTFEKLLFHWDKDMGIEHGSYHTVDGKYYALEVQAYYNINSTPFIIDALHKLPRTVVISRFFKISENNNSAIDAILKNSLSVSLDTLIPSFEEYVTYKGSLVIHPFTEVIKWIISLNASNISKNQLNEFRKVAPTINEGRPIQPLYGRRIYYIVP